MILGTLWGSCIFWMIMGITRGANGILLDLVATSVIYGQDDVLSVGATAAAAAAPMLPQPRFETVSKIWEGIPALGCF